MKKLLFGLLLVFACSVVSFANQPVISALDNEITLTQKLDQTQDQEQKTEKKVCNKKSKKACCAKEGKTDKKACCPKEAKADKKCSEKKACCTKEAKAEKKCDANCTKECCKKS